AEARTDPLRVELDGIGGTDQEHLVKLRCPQRGMRKRVEEALHERARVLVVLSRQRPPLGEETARFEPRPRQLVEIARLQVDDAGRRWRWRLEGDDVVAF